MADTSQRLGASPPPPAPEAPSSPAPEAPQRRAQSAAPVSSISKVRMVDPQGQDYGVELEVAPRPKSIELEFVNDTAKRLKGWSTIVLDNKPLEYSEDNALVLVSRFTWLRDLIFNIKE